MKCLHCQISFHESAKHHYIGRDADENWFVDAFLCPACNRFNLFLVNTMDIYERPYVGICPKDPIKSVPFWPKASSRLPCPDQVQGGVREDYLEACLVLQDSPKASAALSRRCLQTLLREKAGVKPGNLANEIQEVLDSKAIPTYLADSIDAIRNIGNFAAHPLKSTNTGGIMPVEAGEAEWNLDLLESLFDFYYVQPDVIEKKRQALNNKLKEVGKPAMKTA